MGCTQTKTDSNPEGVLHASRKTTYKLNIKSEKITDFVDFGGKKVALGEGMTGEVVKATYKSTGTPVAVKKVSKHTVKDLKALRLEIELLSNLDHPNVVKILDAFEDSKTLYMILEICPGGDLLDQLLAKKNHRYTEREAQNILIQMCRAVGYIHAKGICHRDLKMDNWLFTSTENDNQELKLIDFGLSKKYYNATKAVADMKTFLGTPGFVAPEIQQAYYGEIDHYDNAIDMWSLGVIAYCLVSGKMPFKRRGGDCVPLDDKLNRAYAKNFKSGIWADGTISKECHSFIDALLAPDPGDRMTPEECLKHPWLKTLVAHKSVAFDKKTLENLKYFSSAGAKEKAAMTIMAECLHPEDIVDLRDKFLDIDAKNPKSSGFITWGDMKQVLEASHADKFTVEQIHKLFSEIIVDSHCQESMVYTEFLAATMDHGMLHNKNRLKDAFRRLDPGNSGFVDMSELEELFSAVALKGNRKDDLTRKVRNASKKEKRQENKISFRSFCDILDKEHAEQVEKVQGQQVDVTDIKFNPTV